MNAKQLEKGRWSKEIIRFYSIKNQQRYWCESHLERDALLRLEFDDEVESYKAQPMSISHIDLNGKPSRYTPDQLIKRFSQGYVFREVKVESRVDDALKAKIAWICRHTNEIYKAPLEIITDNEIRVGAVISNLNILYSYKRVCIDHVDLEQLDRILPSGFSFSDLKEMSQDLKYRETIPYALLAHGVFKFDRFISLDDLTTIKKV